MSTKYFQKNRKIPDGKRNLEVNEGIKCSLKEMTKGEKQKNDFFKMKFNWILSWTVYASVCWANNKLRVDRDATTWKLVKT